MWYYDAVERKQAVEKFTGWDNPSVFPLFSPILIYMYSVLNALLDDLVSDVCHLVLFACNI